MFDKIISGGKLEKKVIENIKSHIQIFCSSAQCFKNAIEKGDRESTFCVAELEREADSVKREITSTIYEGAFLPFIRPNICRFIEIVDDALGRLKDAAFEFRYLNPELYKIIFPECVKIAIINTNMCDLLYIAFESLLTKRNDLREKNLAIRVYEKEVDDIKVDILEKIRKVEIKNFWEGEIISNFIENITEVSDLIEYASDYLYIIEISLR